MTSILVPIKALVSQSGIFSYLIWLLEKWLIVYLLRIAINFLLEDRVHHLDIARRWLVEEFPPRLGRHITIWVRVLSVLSKGPGFSFALDLIIFHPLELFYTFHQLVHVFDRILDKGFP